MLFRGKNTDILLVSGNPFKEWLFNHLYDILNVSSPEVTLCKRCWVCNHTLSFSISNISNYYIIYNTCSSYVSSGSILTYTVCSAMHIPIDQVKLNSFPTLAFFLTLNITDKVVKFRIPGVPMCHCTDWV